MKTVYINKKPVEFDPSVDYRKVVMDTGSFEFSYIDMDGFMDSIASGEFPEGSAKKVIGYILEQGATFGKFNTRKCNSIINPHMLKTEDIDRSCELIDSVKNTIEVLEKVKDIYETVEIIS